MKDFKLFCDIFVFSIKKCHGERVSFANRKIVRSTIWEKVGENRKTENWNSEGLDENQLDYQLN